MTKMKRSKKQARGYGAKKSGGKSKKSDGKKKAGARRKKSGWRNNAESDSDYA